MNKYLARFKKNFSSGGLTGIVTINLRECFKRIKQYDYGRVNV